MSDNDTNGDGRNGCRAHQEINCFMNVPGNGRVLLVLLRMGFRHIRSCARSQTGKPHSKPQVNASVQWEGPNAKKER